MSQPHLNPPYPSSDDDQIVETNDKGHEVRLDQHKLETSSTGAVPVFFERSDPENPQTGWPTLKRWRVLFVALFVTYTSAFNASANGAVSGGFRREHPGVTSSVFQTSSFTYLVMLGIGPLVLAPVSETFGRRPMLVILTFLIAILFIPQALAPNVVALIVTRFFQGTMACIEGPVAAGVVADLFPKSSRGPAMGTFVLTVFTANATGPLCANWIAEKISWRYIYWVQLASGFVCFVLCFFFFPETRGDVILHQRAKKLSKETGRPHFVVGLDEHEGWLDAFKTSCARPLEYLALEPIVSILALYVGFAWGVVFLLMGVVVHVFEEVYGFSQGQAGTVLIAGCIGAFIGWCFNITVQERWYQQAIIAGHGRAKPEVRLYSSCIGGILFAIGGFGFGWTAQPSVHWIAPCIFLVILNTGTYSIYLATYNYLGDVYDRYSSSAQAAQSLLRNILGATFPFFAISMYNKLHFTWASTLVGFIALAFAPVPWLLVFYGERARARSKVAVHLANLEGAVLTDEADETPETRATKEGTV